MPKMLNRKRFPLLPWLFRLLKVAMLWLGQALTTEASNAQRPLQLLGDSLRVCAVYAGAETYCWGSNYGGALGLDPTIEDSPTAERRYDLPDFTKFYIGYGGSCVIDMDRQPQCWGRLPTGRRSDKPIHFAETLRFEGQAPSEVEQLAIGGEHFCLLTGDSEVYCAGPQKTETGTVVMADILQRIDSLFDPADPVLELTALLNAQCLRRASGKVYCWGDLGEGVLGNSGTAHIDSNGGVKLLPVDLPEAASSVLSQGFSACALSVAGEVYCWGHLSIEEGADKQMLLAASKVAIAGRARRLFKAFSGYCVESFQPRADLSSQFQCWDLPEGHPLQAAPASDGAVFSYQLEGLELAQGAPCLIDSRGDAPVYCWGRNGSGQAGNGYYSNIPSLTAVVGLPGGPRRPEKQDLEAYAVEVWQRDKRLAADDNKALALRPEPFELRFKFKPGMEPRVTVAVRQGDELWAHARQRRRIDRLPEFIHAGAASFAEYPKNGGRDLVIDPDQMGHHFWYYRNDQDHRYDWCNLDSGGWYCARRVDSIAIESKPRALTTLEGKRFSLFYSNQHRSNPFPLKTFMGGLMLQFQEYSR